MFSRTATTVGAAAVALLLLAGCAAGGAADSAPTTDSGRSPLLQLGMVDGPGQAGFVAADMSMATLSPYSQALYDTLVIASPSNEIQPHLATEWEWNEDRTVLTLTLRDDVEFTDGTKFTADAAAQNVLRFRDGNSQSANLMAGVTDAQAVSDTTLEITLSAPNPSFLLNLSRSAFQESPASFDDPAPVGTGPYTLDDSRTVTDSSYAFVVNDGYWAPELQHYDEIDMNVFKDSTAMQNALIGKQLNATLYLGFDGFENVEAAGYTAHTYNQDWLGLLLFDRTGVVNPAMGDVRVRQAINHAIDRDGMLAALAGGRGEVTTQVFGTETPGYSEELEDAYPFDPDKARELLGDAGFADGFELTIPTTSFVPAAVYDLLTQQLGDVGITVVLDERSPADYIPDLLSGRYAVGSFTLEQPATAWDTYELLAAQGSPWNATHVANAEVDAFGTALQTGTEEEAAAAADGLNEYFVENAWFNPWYRAVTTFYTDATTDVTPQVGNTFPYLWNIVPAGQ